MSDLIRRDTVLRCIKESRENIDWGQSEDGDAFLHYSAALYRTIADKRYVPSAQPEVLACGEGELTAQPERKTGHWKKVSADRYKLSSSYVYKCSECGETHVGKTNYCPHCGTHMKGEPT